MGWLFGLRTWLFGLRAWLFGFVHGWLGAFIASAGAGRQVLRVLRGQLQPGDGAARGARGRHARLRGRGAGAAAAQVPRVTRRRARVMIAQ
jgi:hypothetical protein